MSTATPLFAPESPLSFDENAAAVVRTLIAMRGIDAQTLAANVGMTKSTLYLRLKGKPWLGHELARIATYFDVNPRVFYEPVESLSQNWKLMTGADLEVLDGGDEGGQGRFGHLYLVPTT